MKILLMFAGLLTSSIVLAQTSAPLAVHNTDDPFQYARWLLLFIAVALVVLLFLLVNVTIGVARMKTKSTFRTKDDSSIMNKALPVIGFILFSFPCFGQTTGSVDLQLGDIPADIYGLLVVIGVESIVLLIVLRSIFQFLKDQPVTKTEVQVNKPSLFQRLNQTVALEEESILDLNHNYDGIRELDNKTPRWWTYAFFLSIAFAAIYLYRFYNGQLPGQLTELNRENETAAILKAQFLKTAANQVDETNVQMLEEAGIIKGSMTFSANCAVCHGVNGEGNAIGPNLTDDYWLHKGSLKAIFSSIKYGYVEKGMKSWKEDFSPMQIAELASFVKSLKGSHPTHAKEKQGDLYVETSENNSDTLMLKNSN